MHCVVQSGKVTLMKAGPHLLNFFYFPSPYIEKPKENVSRRPHQSQRQGWPKLLGLRRSRLPESTV